MKAVRRDSAGFMVRPEPEYDRHGGKTGMENWYKDLICTVIETPSSYVTL